MKKLPFVFVFLLKTNTISIKWVNHNSWIDKFVIKKLLFFFVFSTYRPLFLLKFRAGWLVGCEIKFCIQWVPTMHTFDRSRYPQNKKYLKNYDDDVIFTVFQVFLVFGVAGSVKSMMSVHSLDAEFNFASNKLSRLKF